MEIVNTYQARFFDIAVLKSFSPQSPAISNYYKFLKFTRCEKIDSDVIQFILDADLLWNSTDFCVVSQRLFKVEINKKKKYIT